MVVGGGGVWLVVVCGCGCVAGCVAASASASSDSFVLFLHKRLALRHLGVLIAGLGELTARAARTAPLSLAVSSSQVLVAMAAEASMGLGGSCWGEVGIKGSASVLRELEVKEVKEVKEVVGVKGSASGLRVMSASLWPETVASSFRHSFLSAVMSCRWYRDWWGDASMNRFPGVLQLYCIAAAWYTRRP